MDPIECFERLLLQVHDAAHAHRVGGLVVDGVVQGSVHQLDHVVGKLHQQILSSEGGGNGC